MNNIKNKTMRRAGKILSKILDELSMMVEPGLATIKLEQKFLDLCKQNKVVPSCKNYRVDDSSPFPTGLCVGINNECVHCIPSKSKVLEDGDIVVLDTVISLDNYHVDSARTLPVGKISEERKRLINTAKFARSTAINVVKPGAYVGDISNAIQVIVETAGFNVLRDYVGHGIGLFMHESPSIPCFGEAHQGIKLKENMTLAIEPLVSSGDYRVGNKDGSDWETVLVDGSDYAQFEHTVLVTKNGVEILTKS